MGGGEKRERKEGVEREGYICIYFTKY